MSRALVEYEPFAPELRADPYPTYRALLSERPIHWNETLGAHVVVRHADCMRVLREPGWSVDRKLGRRFQMGNSNGVDGEVQPARGGSLLGLDPPDHTRLRNLVSKTFTPRMIERLRPRVESLAEELVVGIALAGRVDFIEAFAYPLPVTVIAEMLGVPTEDWGQFRHWSSMLATALDPVASSGQVRNTLAARRAIYDYLGKVIAKRRADPRDDLISDLIAVEVGGERLAEPEIRMLCILLLVAGHETTVGFLGNGLLSLLRNPGQLERLRADPNLVERAVEELLRYDSPVQLTNRIATEEHVLSGQVISPGDEVITLLGAANHDPDVFAAPETIDLGRDPNPHLTFSRGLHFCLGAPLARLEGHVALTLLLRQLPKLRIDGDPLWRTTLTLRGLNRLPVAV
jgi:cytochrome P450